MFISIMGLNNFALWAGPPTGLACFVDAYPRFRLRVPTPTRDNHARWGPRFARLQHGLISVRAFGALSMLLFDGASVRVAPPDALSILFSGISIPLKLCPDSFSSGQATP